MTGARKPARVAHRAAGALDERLLTATGAFATAVPMVLGIGVVALLMIVAWPRVDAALLGNGTAAPPPLVGIAPVLFGTLSIALIAAAVAIPLGLGAAVWLEEARAQSRGARLLGFALEASAGVPTIVYGWLALEALWAVSGAPSLAIAGLALGIHGLGPTASGARRALRRVPEHQRDAALALGAHPWQVMRWVVLPGAARGLTAAAFDSVSRALGDTVVVLVLGAAPLLASWVPGDTAFGALPSQIFYWFVHPNTAYQAPGAAAILLLMGLLGLMGLALRWTGRRLGGQTSRSMAFGLGRRTFRTPSYPAPPELDGPHPASGLVVPDEAAEEEE